MSPDRLAKRQRRAGHGEAGFTLVELAVATAVLLFAVLLACELLDESGRLLHHSVRRARDPWTLIAGELLRNDLRAALPPDDPPVGPDLPWEGTLRLDISGGGVVEWGRNPRHELVRKPVPGNPYTYIHEVESFRWRTFADNDAVEVWVRYHVSSPYLRQLAGSPPRADAGEDVDLHVLVVARGGAREW